MEWIVCVDFIKIKNLVLNAIASETINAVYFIIFNEKNNKCLKNFFNINIFFSSTSFPLNCKRYIQYEIY